MSAPEPTYSLDGLSSDQRRRAYRDLNDFVVEEGGCRIWTGSQGGEFANLLPIDGLFLIPQRLSYQLCVGSISEDEVIEPDCGNLGCIFPAHLSIAPYSRRDPAPLSDKAPLATPTPTPTPTPSLTHDQIIHHEVTPEAFGILVRVQGNTCGVCKAPADTVPFSVDWNFDRCSEVPCESYCAVGLLCAECLEFVGTVRENIERYDAVFDYLRDR